MKKENITNRVFVLRAYGRWWVSYLHQRIEFCQDFFASEHGGPQGAEDAAQACKAQILRALENCETREEIRAAFAAIKSQYKPQQ
ncbi:hypothetical protein ICN84_07790 [Akkermansia glycaniphila]|uniref:hypothetical protein n=1 Tax=Akkermansia glycaniphila TaxID=1679444 RepID=UPI001C034B35|nr:hypothetical protein [Akkermansia glycaniphila]MBT9449974.1 hypothetical protein [Akkermansia glycaniphila]